MKWFRAVWPLGAAAAVASLAAASGPAVAPEQGARPGRARVGVYDNRAVAVAFARSKWSPVKAKMAEHQAAKRAGDSAKVAALEKWGQSHQRLMHFQGFGHVPVGGLLAPVKKDLAALGRRMGLSAIALECDYTAPGVETVDITGAIVELYQPDDETRKVVAQLKRVKPMPLVDLANMPANE